MKHLRADMRVPLLTCAQIPLHHSPANRGISDRLRRNHDNQCRKLDSAARFIPDVRSRVAAELWAQEFDYMQAVGMDMIVVLAVGHLRLNPADPLRYSLSADGLLYPSMWGADS